MKLEKFIHHFSPDHFSGNTAAEIRGITSDSREVRDGYVFFAIRGTRVDGHDFIDRAIEQGAVCIVCDTSKFTLYTTVRSSIAWVTYSNVARACGFWANLYYGEPHKQLILTGITGTNGKTTIATLCYQVFTSLGFKCGLLSTIENRIGRAVLPATHTTPDPVSLNRLLAEMVEAGCRYAFMEVSSHAIHQERIAALQYDAAIFTNVTHDHLDYHGSFREYIDVKKRLFDDLGSHALAIANMDDKRAGYMLQNTVANKVAYGLHGNTKYPVRIIENGIQGLVMQVEDKEIHSSLLGIFNASNLMAVYTLARELQFDRDEILLALSSQTPVPGRFECIYNPSAQVLGIVDYAHTPDALEKILRSVDAIRQGGRIHTVVGCGGNRDKQKRPLMARIAVSWSDRVILTSDNPRDEDPQSIIDDMIQGITPEFTNKYIAIPDRTQAIKAACMHAEAGDVIVVAGKGHEQYQEIKGVKHPFDDREVLRRCFEGLEINLN